MALGISLAGFETKEPYRQVTSFVGLARTGK